MQELDDNALLREYVEHDSEEAFAALVTRHVNKVYSVALRHTGSPHQAEEITQAVFVILARKSRNLSPRVILSGWLYQTARLTSVTFIRSQIRRARREQEAYMQTILNENDPAAWSQISPLLDAAMAGLNETDRHAVVLRFFDGKSMKEVGDALGANEEAAKKRVTRAVEKLQTFFRKRGVTSTAATITGVISANSVQAAPAALAQAATATAAAIAKGGVAGGSTLVLVKATLFAMKTKTIAATISAAVVLLGVGGYLAYQAKTAHAAAADAAEVLPLKFANDDFSANNDDRFEMGVDPAVKRTATSEPAGHIKSLVASKSSGSADYLASIGGKKEFAASRYVRRFVSPASRLLGKRVRISGWMKSANLSNWAGANLLISSEDGHIFADDNMTDRPIHGTTDWQPVEFVADVPKEPCWIIFAPVLYGAGEFWCDDFQLDIVPDNTPITDDRKWHFWSQNATAYSTAKDYNVTHDGHPAFCITYTPDVPAPKSSWMWWGQDIRNPDKYLGKTVRMTVWAKSENVSGSAGPNLRPKGANFKLLASDGQAGHHPIRGTMDWAQYTIVCKIPKETQCLDTGFYFGGSGKVWIDLESIKYEIVK